MPVGYSFFFLSKPLTGPQEEPTIRVDQHFELRAIIQMSLNTTSLFKNLIY